MKKAIVDVIAYIVKNTPRRPILRGGLIYHCPNCDRVVGYIQLSYIEGFERKKKCKHCEQKLEWRKEKP